MRRFAHAAVLAVSMSAPILAGALVDHSVLSVLGAPCSVNCGVGGAPGGMGGRSSDEQAQGGLAVGTNKIPPETAVASGTSAVPGGQSTGHVTETTPSGSSTFSGNFTTVPHGHCTQNGITVACP
jgi:hypothetical protein